MASRRDIGEKHVFRSSHAQWRTSEYVGSTDVTGRASGQDRSMWIRLRIDSTDPPCGELVRERHSPVAFTGWLELLRVVGDALESAAWPPNTCDSPARQE